MGEVERRGRVGRGREEGVELGEVERRGRVGRGKEEG